MATYIQDTRIVVLRKRAWTDTMTNTRSRNAAHEVAYYLIARKYGLKIKRVSILCGSGIQPAITFDSSEMLAVEEMLKVYLAGWVGEAYVRSHRSRAGEFAQIVFMKVLPVTGSGAGWPCALFSGGNSDIAKSLRLGIHWLRLAAPFRILLELGREIHSDRYRFFRMYDELEAEYTLSEQALDALYNGESLAEALKSETRFLAVELLAKDGFWTQ